MALSPPDEVLKGFGGAGDAVAKTPAPAVSIQTGVA
jgi:hypothetical protein